MAAKLTARQERFVAEYAAHGNGAAAARAAGYAVSSAKVTASRLLTKANLQAALGAYEREAKRLLGTTREQVLLRIQDAIEAARAKEEPMTEIAGWREIAKLCGFYKQAPARKKMTERGARLKAEIESMSDEELFERLTRVP